MLVSEMRPCTSRFAHRAQPRTCRGATAVEFALVFPLFFMLFYGIVAYGFALTLKQSLTLAAEEGARAALQYAPSVDVRRANAEARATSVLSWLPAGSITVAANDGVGCAACVQVVTSYNYGNYPIVPSLSLFGIGVIIPDTLSATATVQL